ncbi:MAG: DUF2953 domain-containing protein [Oscillospiraceae bacterium]|nr:DUF2953 domain-containing protein [Oscillospiraceae bacterium]
MKILLAVVLVVAALAALLLLLRLGGRVEYSAQGLLVQLKIGPAFLTVYPRNPRQKKEKKKSGKKKTDQPKKPQEPPRPSLLQRVGGSLDELMDELPALLDLLGESVEKLRVDELLLDYTIAGRANPAQAGILYGGICATGGAVAGVLGQKLNIKERSVRCRVDFTAVETKVYVRLTLSYTVAQLLVLSVHVLKELQKIRNILDKPQQEENKNGKKASAE